MKYFKWFLKSILFGIIFLFVFNFIGQYINVNIPINIWSILIVGCLKVPGAICILLFNLW
ncbi:MAG: pro-sigmaK processing inhibitor BofA family protein [Bacilli bacterium]|nr:pro-sigmaK processing inhibitor BofA family protein [Bacilli bacterium]